MEYVCRERIKGNGEIDVDSGVRKNLMSEIGRACIC